MALHDELLSLSKELVDRNPGIAADADLRRGISTAYYALFHLLVHHATTHLIAITSVQSRVARSFEHKIMRAVCKDYAVLKPNHSGQIVLLSSGQAVPQGIVEIASTFESLQQARHKADYDTAAHFTQPESQFNVLKAELAFLDWAAVQGDPAADTFLAELLCRGIAKR
jgi:hypothetical protein